MTVKKNNIRKEIDSQFEVQQHEEDIDDFENPFADAVQNLISDDIQTLHSEDISERFSSLRKRSFIDNKAGKGKSTSRNKVFKHYFNSLDESKSTSKESDESDIEEDVFENDSVQDFDGENEDALYGEEGTDVDDNSNEEYDTESEGGEGKDDEDGEDDSSIIGSGNDDDADLNNDTLDQHFLYSKQSKTSEIEKGIAVQHQISLWDSFLECRIRLQKAIVAFNKFPTQDIMNKYNLQEKLKKEIGSAEESIQTLMETLITLHEQLCKQYQGIENSSSSFKRTLPSPSTGGVKKRKLDEYNILLDEMKSNFSSYQSEAIQKWNDKTKIASGKMNNANLAVDQSVLAQIEHILNDKARLVRRTQQRKSKYNRLGEIKSDSQEEKIEDEYDVETFDDDDFYHKILRDYIEKKTVDVNDPHKLGKQWMELQKLRSKMKRKVDVKCTKGRRLRYGVHEKLVNFMAPVLSHQWNPESEAELFKSLFGRRK